MNNRTKGILLRIFINENAHFDGHNLLELIVEEAKRQNLAGATAFRGIMGYQSGSKIQTATILRLSENMPIVIEIVDSEEKIEAFLPFLNEVVKHGLVTTEVANIVINPQIDRK